MFCINGMYNAFTVVNLQSVTLIGWEMYYTIYVSEVYLCKYIRLNVNNVYGPQSLAALPPELTVSKWCHGDCMHAWYSLLFLLLSFYFYLSFSYDLLLL